MNGCPAHGNRIQLNPSRAVNQIGAGLRNDIGGSQDATTGLRSRSRVQRCPPHCRCGSRSGTWPNGPVASASSSLLMRSGLRCAAPSASTGASCSQKANSSGGAGTGAPAPTLWQRSEVDKSPTMRCTGAWLNVWPTKISKIY